MKRDGIDWVCSAQHWRVNHSLPKVVIVEMEVLSQRCMVTWLEAQVPPGKIHLDIGGRFFTLKTIQCWNRLMKWASLATVTPRLENLQVASSQALFQQNVGPYDLQRSLPTQTCLWFSDIGWALLALLVKQQPSCSFSLRTVFFHIPLLHLPYLPSETSRFSSSYQLFKYPGKDLSLLLTLSMKHRPSSIRAAARCYLDLKITAQLGLEKTR